MFRSLAAHDARCVTVTIDGRPFRVLANASAAEALLAANVPAFRSHAPSGTLRAAYCLMGSCFECLVTIDDVPGCQSCLVQVQEGMRIERPGEHSFP